MLVSGCVVTIARIDLPLNRLNSFSGPFFNLRASEKHRHESIQGGPQFQLCMSYGAPINPPKNK